MRKLDKYSPPKSATHNVMNKAGTQLTISRSLVQRRESRHAVPMASAVLVKIRYDRLSHLPEVAGAQVHDNSYAFPCDATDWTSSDIMRLN